MSTHGSIRCTICQSSDVKEKLNLPAGKKIMLCRNCKNAFTSPKPVLPDYSAEDFQAGTGVLDKLTFLEELPEEIRTSYAVQLAMIEQKIPKGASILEIGGGEGIFLKLVKDRGYDVELVEPSVSASKRAATRGLHVKNNYIENVTFDKKFSLVFLSHVLEHIEDPLSAIDRIKKLLKPQGCFLLTQTNFNGFMPRLLQSKWYAWVPDQHFSHFSLAGLKYMARRSSLNVLDYKYSRLVHGKSVYHDAMKYIPILQDQIHIMLQMN